MPIAHWSNRNSSTGKKSERQAEQFLRARGLVVVKRNFRCKTGEIDLIMRDGAALVFVEVRHRSNRHFGSGAETVDWRKQQKLIRAASHFLVTHPRYNDYSCRFDVVTSDTDADEPLWYQNAFDSSTF
jgi:putative endonuclease